MDSAVVDAPASPEFIAVKFSPTFAAIAEALALAQTSFGRYAPDSTAKVESNRATYSYNYAKLPDVLAAVRPSLNAQGISVLQAPTSEGPAITVETILLHRSGEWIANRLKMVAGDARPQSIGSAITYARRYALQALVGVAPDEDDDGARANHRDAPPPVDELEQQRQKLAAQERDAIGWIESLITKRSIPVDAVEALTGELTSEALSDWRELNLEGKRRLFDGLRKRFSTPPATVDASNANAAPGASQTGSDGQEHSGGATTASERPETKVLTASETPATDPTAEMLAWTAQKLRDLGLADDDADLLALVAELADSIDGRVTYDWRGLSPAAMRQFISRLMSTRDRVS